MELRILLESKSRVLVPGIAFNCQEVLDLNLASTYIRPSQDSNPRPPDQTAEALTNVLCLLAMSLFRKLTLANLQMAVLVSK